MDDHGTMPIYILDSSATTLTQTTSNTIHTQQCPKTPNTTTPHAQQDLNRANSTHIQTFKTCKNFSKNFSTKRVIAIGLVAGIAGSILGVSSSLYQKYKKEKRYGKSFHPVGNGLGCGVIAATGHVVDQNG